MFPIKDDVIRQKIPIVTWGLIALNIIIFIYQIKLPQYQLMQFLAKYSLIPASFFSQEIKTNYYTLVSSMFLHGSFQHILSNMWILWLFGDNVEDRMGSFSFLMFYLICGIIAGISHIYLESRSLVPSIGASGAIAGVMAAYMLLFPGARVLTLVPIFIIPRLISLPSVIFIGIWFITQLLYGMMAFFENVGIGGIAWWAHIGGFLGGLFLYSFFLKRKYRYNN